MSQLLPVPDLIRRLRLHSRRHGDIKAIAGMGEINHDHLRRIAREGRMSVRMQALLSAILERVDRGEVAFKMNTPRVKADAPVNSFIIEERPANAPMFQRRIVRANEYSRWARCSACGGIRFSPITRTGSLNPSVITHFACDG